MSTELIGNCGYTVGERGYFERINNVFLTLGHSFSSCHNLRSPHDIFILS